MAQSNRFVFRYRLEIIVDQNLNLKRSKDWKFNFDVQRHLPARYKTKHQNTIPNKNKHQIVENTNEQKFLFQFKQ